MNPLAVLNLVACRPTYEGLPNREGPKLGEIGGGHSGGTRGHAGWGYARVTPSLGGMPFFLDAIAFVPHSAPHHALVINASCTSTGWSGNMQGRLLGNPNQGWSRTLFTEHEQMFSPHMGLT